MTGYAPQTFGADDVIDTWSADRRSDAAFIGFRTREARDAFVQKTEQLNISRRVGETDVTLKGRPRQSKEEWASRRETRALMRASGEVCQLPANAQSGADSMGNIVRALSGFTPKKLASSRLKDPLEYFISTWKESTIWPRRMGSESQAHRLQPATRRC